MNDNKHKKTGVGTCAVAQQVKPVWQQQQISSTKARQRAPKTSTKQAPHTQAPNIPKSGVTTSQTWGPTQWRRQPTAAVSSAVQCCAPPTPPSSIQKGCPADSPLHRLGAVCYLVQVRVVQTPHLRPPVHLLGAVRPAPGVSGSQCRQRRSTSSHLPPATCKRHE